MSFSFQPLSIRDVVAVRPTRHVDGRGSFTEIYREETFRREGIDARFVQDNLARSVRNVLRGLHYQLPPAAQGKLVAVARGRIYDVAVDLRRDAPTFGQWVARTLDADRAEMLWIPPGFAHGYCVLSAVADVMYKVTQPYVAELNRGIRWDDPRLDIPWPVADPILSASDGEQPDFERAENLFRS